MNRYLILLFAPLLYFGTGATAEAQRKKKDDPFPTYEQIRGNRTEIFDYVEPVNILDNTKPTTRVMTRYYNAFNYPADSTTYYLNGRKAKNAKAAEAELMQKAGNIDRVMIGPTDHKGRRDIEIDYVPKKE